ncbi:MAG: iron-sulfur cluster assembly accessory protein, partial [Chitinophagales bacterium]
MEEVLKTSPVKLTEGAYEKMKNIFEQKSLPADHGIRIGVKGGGCAGFSYILGFDSPKEKDRVYTFKDMKVIMEDA